MKRLLIMLAVLLSLPAAAQDYAAGWINGGWNTAWKHTDSTWLMTFTYGTNGNGGTRTTCTYPACAAGTVTEYAADTVLINPNNGAQSSLLITVNGPNSGVVDVIDTGYWKWVGPTAPELDLVNGDACGFEVPPPALFPLYTPWTDGTVTLYYYQNGCGYASRFINNDVFTYAEYAVTVANPGYSCTLAPGSTVTGTTVEFGYDDAAGCIQPGNETQWQGEWVNSEAPWNVQSAPVCYPGQSGVLITNCPAGGTFSASANGTNVNLTGEGTSMVVTPITYSEANIVSFANMPWNYKYTYCVPNGHGCIQHEIDCYGTFSWNGAGITLAKNLPNHETPSTTGEVIAGAQYIYGTWTKSPTNNYLCPGATSTNAYFIINE